jgi:hypothetical protein
MRKAFLRELFARSSPIPSQKLSTVATKHVQKRNVEAAHVTK